LQGAEPRRGEAPRRPAIAAPLIWYGQCFFHDRGSHVFSADDIRFPVFQTWPAAAMFASQTLEKRRDGVRLMVQLSVALAGLAAAAAIVRRLGRVSWLSDVVALLAGLAVGCVIATAVASASMLSWRLRWHRMLAVEVRPRDKVQGAHRPS
jgi:hypothetical protein